MTRFLSRSVAVVSLVAAAGCASMGSSQQVFITTSQSLVTNCQDLGEVAARSWTRDDDVLASLDHAARQKGANYVLLKADGARSGVAYRCAMPSASPTASGS
jgi:hypothetical protein